MNNQDNIKKQNDVSLEPKEDTSLKKEINNDKEISQYQEEIKSLMKMIKKKNILLTE